MKAYRYEQKEIESILKRIKHKLIKQMGSHKNGYLELKEDEQSLTLNFKTKKTPSERKVILDELAGSGLGHGREFIVDSLRLADREGEEDREDLNLG